MADERYTFAQARERLEEIVTQVRKKDVSLEQSLDLLEEGVRLANVCTELSDHTEWRSVAGESEDASDETVATDDVSGDEPAVGADPESITIEPGPDGDNEPPE
ncbi:MAG: exodeoxyribonuclease VII small subunit [Coriobacteriia bacterium]|nr:exodeoxyribonuclease VII small subunit [Coriobacteriia bacterium]